MGIGVMFLCNHGAGSWRRQQLDKVHLPLSAFRTWPDRGTLVALRECSPGMVPSPFVPSQKQDRQIGEQIRAAPGRSSEWAGALMFRVFAPFPGNHGGRCGYGSLFFLVADVTGTIKPAAQESPVIHLRFECAAAEFNPPLSSRLPRCSLSGSADIEVKRRCRSRGIPQRFIWTILPKTPSTSIPALISTPPRG
jgi:hypothetical protein